jgi:hypothetical protein
VASVSNLATRSGPTRRIASMRSSSVAAIQLAAQDLSKWGCPACQGRMDLVTSTQKSPAGADQKLPGRGLSFQPPLISAIRSASAQSALLSFTS